MAQVASARPGYDWRACFIAIAVGLSVATAAVLLVTRLVDSALLLTAVVTVTGTSVSTWIYGRVPRKGARPIDKDDCKENCPL
jgi:hypothetical protein